MIINFGEWLPDSPDFANPGCTEAKNCIPVANSYQQLNSLSAYTTALDARCRGALSCKDKDGNAYNFAGDAGKLYSLASGTFSDVSKSGGYAAGDSERWEFAKFGENIIATNWSNPMQSITLGAANFADLAGTPPQARHIGVVRDFLVTGNTYDATDGNVPHRVRWSAFNDITDWAYSASTQAGLQDLAGSGGWVQRIIGGEYGIIFQEHSIWRMSYEGPPILFRFDEVEPGRGTPAPGSVIALGANIFYLGQDGFYYFNTQSSTPIGKDKIDTYFWNDVDPSYLHLVSATIDPVNSLVMWAYPGVGHSGICNKLIMFNWSTGRWTHAEANTELLVSALSTGYTLESLDALGDLDSLTASMDSRLWSGGNTLLSAFDSTHKQASFTGAALTALLRTREFQITPGRRTSIRAIRPIADGGTHAVRLGTRNNQADAVEWGASIPQAPSGRFATRENTRYASVELQVSGGFNSIQAVDVDGKARGKR